MLTAICGRDYRYNMGNLKTYTMTLLAKANFEMGEEIYSNYTLGFPYTPITNFNELIEELDQKRHVTVLLDELSMYFDAYMPPSKKDGTSAFKGFARQTRKRGIKVYYTQQTPLDVHKSLRRVTNIWYTTTKLHTDFTPCTDDECRLPHILKMENNIMTEEGLFPVTTKYYNVVPEIFDIYDSEEIIEIT